MDKKDELIRKLEEYNRLLVREIDSLIGVAAVHGWKSQLVEEGEKLRSDIANLKAEISMDSEPVLGKVEFLTKEELLDKFGHFVKKYDLNSILNRIKNDD